MTDPDHDIVAALNQWRTRALPRSRSSERKEAKKQLHVVYRAISMYSGDDQYLGFFSSRTKAEAAKRRYLQQLKEHGDPWAEQGYVDKVDPDRETHVMVLEDARDFTLKRGELVYAVFSGASYMGQGNDSLYEPHADPKKAVAARLEADAREEGLTFRSWFTIRVYRLDECHLIGNDSVKLCRMADDGKLTYTAYRDIRY